MNHYFTNDENPVQFETISFWFNGVEETFVSAKGVFSKDTLDYGTRVLLETMLKRQLKGELLDLGCGIGYIGVLLKKYCPQLSVTMVDINKTATLLAQKNSERYGQENTVADMDGISTLDRSFDIIAANPPIRTGKENIYRLFREAFDHLKPEGVLYVVIRKQQGAASALRYLNTLSQADVIEKSNGYWVICLHKTV